MFANVVVLRNLKQIDKFFTYSVPEALDARAGVGARCIVPFGTEWVEAVVFERFSEFETPTKYAIKPIQHVFEDGICLRPRDVELVRFIKAQYLCTYSEACALILPSGIMTVHDTVYELALPLSAALERAEKKAERVILTHFEDGLCKKPCDFAALYADSTVKNTLNKLVAKGCVSKRLIFETVVKDRYESWLEPTEKTLDILKVTPKRNTAQIKVMTYLLDKGATSKKACLEALKTSPGVIDVLAEKGAIALVQKEVLRLPTFFEGDGALRKSVLNAAQQTVFDAVCSGGCEKPFLIHGVTGSGKTEVYAALIERALASGKRAVLLVPEIALTPQIVARFVSRFGKERIALIHSKISRGERYDQWKGILSGRYDIVIGARSAIFTPVENLGLIIIDEAHEASYRSEKRPKYNTFELAQFKASQSDAQVVLGSATPSIDDYHSAQMGAITYLPLDVRYNQKPLPETVVVDMRDELTEGNRSMLSRLLHEKIEAALSRREQVMIMMNRKGHSTFVSCRTCGFTLDCPNCDVTLTYFKGEKSVKCNYCGYETFVPKTCPACSSHYFKYFGAGTEKVEEHLKSLFPDAVIDRMDRTTTTKKGSVERIIENVSHERTDILIGTQMIAKGLDFKKVSLVGILSADLMLNLPHYNAAERAYQLFTQVAGRAGRAAIEGEVVLQTYTPDHYALAPESYEAFYNEEILYRQAMGYPPFTQLVNLVFTSKRREEAEGYAKRSEAYLKKKLFKDGLQSKVESYPAAMALLKKIDNHYRYQLLMKVAPEAMTQVRLIVGQLEEKFISITTCQIHVDLDAVNIL